MEFGADELLEVKVIETRLAYELALDDMSCTSMLVQLDENMFVADAGARWSEQRVDPAPTRDTFWFPDRDQVIGLRAAADRGLAD